MNVTALEVVGALVALAGTALVLNVIFLMDGLSVPAVSEPIPQASQPKHTPQRRAA
jgi:hypothetical protein